MNVSMNTEPINALVWTGDEHFELVACPFPRLAEGETLIRLTTATICGSDRHTVSGRRSQPCPSVLGHEGVGVVQETNNPSLAVGQRVIFSVTAPCMDCDRCSSGRTAKCRRVMKTGHEPFNGQWPLSGTYSTHMVLRAHQPIAVVPPSLGDVPASIASCAGATVMAAFGAARTSATSLKDKRVLVVGLGMLGLIAVEAAMRSGATVTAIDPNFSRREFAAQLGARAVDPIGFTRSADRAQCFDVAMEFSGSPNGVMTCVKSLDIGGVAVLAGSVADSPDIDLDPEWIVRGWRTITGVHNYEPHHLEQAIEFFAESKIDWSAVTDGPITLENAPAAFRRPSGDGMRTVVDLTRPPFVSTSFPIA